MGTSNSRETKDYVDVFVYECENCYVVGMAVRDHTMVFLRGKTMKFEGCVSVLEAELVGVLEAFLWTRELPAQPIIVETDSLLSVNAINGLIQIIWNWGISWSIVKIS